MAVEEDPPAGVPEWVVTFGDMMSLLLTFFIMLVSFSEIKEEDKYQAMVEALQEQFGYDLTTASVVPGNAKPRNSALAKIAASGRARKFDIMDGGNKVHAPTGDHTMVRILRQGERTAIGTVIFFSEDAVALNDEQRRDLELVASQLIGKPQIIEIRGHTSMRPAERFTPYADNWELAYQRCRAAMTYLVEELGIEPQRIRLSLAGPNEPLHLGTDPAKLQQNPRVEIFLTDEVAEDRVGSESERRERYMPHSET